MIELGFQGVFMKKNVVRQATNINLMDFDWKRNLVYWTDERGLLMRSNENLGNVKVIETSGAGKLCFPTEMCENHATSQHM